MAVDTVPVPTEEMEELVKQFSKLATVIAYQTCISFVEKIKEEYPKVPKEEFVKLIAKMFKENNLQIDAKVQPQRSKVKDENRCKKILTTGKRQGHRCSLRRTEGSEYCKRHRNKLLDPSSKNESSYQDRERNHVLESYIKELQPKVADNKKPSPLKLKKHKDDSKNLYLEESTKIAFRLVGDEYVAFGIYIEGQGIAKLSEEEKIICERNYWKYEE